MKIDGKDKWIFKLEEDTEVTLAAELWFLINNDWAQINYDGTILIKKGYSWDGCTPKFSFWDIVVGTPDGIIDKQTGKPKTYYASLLHDAMYQFANKDIVKRKDVDSEFLRLMQRQNFKLAKLYYYVVRIFGGIWWSKNARQK